MRRRLDAGLALAAFALVVAAPARAAEWTYLALGEPSRATCAEPPAGWQAPDFDDAPWLALNGGARMPDAGAPRCEAVRMRRRFDIGPELARLTTLTLAIRYQDGFIAWVNGVEVARRRMTPPVPGTPPTATESHGPETERIFIPMLPNVLRPTGNVLAIEVRAARPTRVPFADAGLAGADALRIVRGPHLLRTDGGEAQVAIETDLPTRAEARYGLAGADPRRDKFANADELDTRHVLRLPGLAAGRTYRYRITLREPLGTAPISVEAAFHTPPTASHPLRFIVTGDVRSGHAVHEQIVRSIVAEDPDLVLMTGDLVDTGSDEAEWQRFFAIEAPLLRQIPVYAALGNHDHWRREEGLPRAQRLFGRGGEHPWWSFDVAGVHFVLLDSDSYRNPEQLAWLKEDLAAARGRGVRALFACMHHGPWSSALHGDNHTAIRDYVPVLEAAGVTLIFAGHDHDYERGRVGRTDYVVSGGGGAELRAPRCGAPGKPRCPSRVRAFFNEHHYISVELTHDRVRLCPRRPDGTLLESCPVIPLRR